jgi:hypothetical protein
MRFMMIMIPEVYRQPVRPDFMPDPKAIERMSKYNEELKKAGVLLTLDGLTPPSTGVRVSFVGGTAKVIEVPMGGDVIGGYWMLRVNSREEAIDWAKRCPAGANDLIDIRQVHDPEDFGQKR